MNTRKIYSFSILAVVTFFAWTFGSTPDTREDFSEVAKIALRDVGNRLLLSGHDSTSLILPIVELEEAKYQLSFQNEMSFAPDVLVSAVEESFQTSGLPSFYRVEVIQHSDQEVGYSYEMKGDRENSIIPCSGRVLPKNNYKFEVKFTEQSNSVLSEKALLFAPGIASLILFAFPFYKKKKNAEAIQINGDFSTLGSFKFYPEQSKLEREGLEVSLSKKECELLIIFSENPNQLITRDELTKKVWEDNGVFVGRSLDTFISKLRKRLKDDKSIQLTNVHGVGYKLEVNQ